MTTDHIAGQIQDIDLTLRKPIVTWLQPQARRCATAAVVAVVKATTWRRLAAVKYLAYRQLDAERLTGR